LKRFLKEEKQNGAIVYPPGRSPYILVVLTRAIPDEHVAQALIADISRLVWTHATGTPAAARAMVGR
ncbi:MAG: hypothetical protein ABJA80_16550, partial [bacterium]